jgi:hypothetical protein
VEGFRTAPIFCANIRASGDELRRYSFLIRRRCHMKSRVARIHVVKDLFEEILRGCRTDCTVSGALLGQLWQILEHCDGSHDVAGNDGLH